MTCDKCLYADWTRTSNGRLHPNKSGHCSYPWEMPPLPAAKYWLSRGAPEPFGGSITRGVELSRPCPYRREE